MSGLGRTGPLGGTGDLHGVEYVLSDPSVGDLSRPRSATGVGRAPTRQCAGGVRGLSRPARQSGMALAAPLQGDLARRSGFCGYGPDGPSTPPWLAWADSDPEQLLALSPWAWPLPGRAPRGGTGA